MDLAELNTPSLVLDVARVRRNAARIGDIARRNSVRLRPHIKTHKCIEVARIQTEGFDGSITVSTLAEARAFAGNGFRNITYAVPIEPGKFEAAIDLMRDGVELNLLTDDAATVGLLDAAAAGGGVRPKVFVKIDCGTHRVGVEPDSAEALEIPRRIADSANLELAGILTHAGHSYDQSSIDGIRAVARHERNVMVTLAERLRADGVDVGTVSIGSTPTINHIDHLDGIDEVRPGNYIFFDAYQATLGSCTADDTALTVLAAVIHCNTAQRKLVVDAGGIALSKDRGPVGLDPACGYGRVLDVDGRDTGLRLDSLSQEHGEIHGMQGDALDRFKVGDRVRILANHSCLTAAQHSHYHVLEGETIVDRWMIHRGW